MCHHICLGVSTINRVNLLNTHKGVYMMSTSLILVKNGHVFVAKIPTVALFHYLPFWYAELSFCFF